MANEHVRKEAKRKKVSLWEVAHFLGISEATMTRMLRTPLSNEKETGLGSFLRTGISVQEKYVLAREKLEQKAARAAEREDPN